jgi:DNA topoisomerase-1
MKLVIVETSAQAKFLSEALGHGWRIEACHGQLRDLPAAALGIDLTDDFRPTFSMVPGKGNLARRLIKAIRESEAVYAATPPNRAGEAMAWQVLALAPDLKDKPVYRVRLPALTLDSLPEAFAAPRPLDMQQVEAYITRRIINRLVSWCVNAAARKAVGGKSALSMTGMLALRLLAAGQDQLAAHTPKTGWRACVSFEREGTTFSTQVMNAKGAPLRLRSANQAAQLETLLRESVFWLDATGQTRKTHPAPDALTLPALLQGAESQLALAPGRVLKLLETLYEAGWVSHPDSAPMPEASTAARAYIRREWGAESLASSDVQIRAGIAPTDIDRLPDNLPGDGAALYALIWKYFITAHMAPAQERIMAARILVGTPEGEAYPLQLRAAATLLYVDGWRRVLPTAAKDEVLPFMRQGDELQLARIAIEAQTSPAPDRYSPASLICALLALGADEGVAVGALAELYAAEAVVAADGHLTLTEHGAAWAAYLMEMFGDLTSPDDARALSLEIERVAAGERTRTDVLRAFWSRFGALLRPNASASSRTDIEHKPLVLRPAQEG